MNKIILTSTIPDRRLIISGYTKPLRETKIENRVESKSSKHHRNPLQQQNSLDDVPDINSIQEQNQDVNRSNHNI